MSIEPVHSTYGLIIVGDEILSGRRVDGHLVKVIELLTARGLSLGWAEVIGDEPARITATLRRVFASSDVVFSTGGIGATPDDRTRACAAEALGEPLQLHPEAKRLIQLRQQLVAREAGEPWAPDRADNVHRLNMGVFPKNAEIIPNPYNQIPGFSCRGPGGGAVHFVPGFPVMAWPMIEWVLDQQLDPAQQAQAWRERSVIVLGASEAILTPIMNRVEAEHDGVKVFSLPSVDHPDFGPHIDLGVRGAPTTVDAAFDDLLRWMQPLGLRYGPQSTRP